MQQGAKRTSYSKTLLKYRKKLLRADFIAVLLSSFLAVNFRFGTEYQAISNSTFSILLVLLLPLYWLFALRFKSVWSFVNLEFRSNSLASVLRSGWWATVFLGFSAYLLHDAISRAWLLIATMLTLSFLVINRLIFHYFFRRSYKSKIDEKYILIADSDAAYIESEIPTRHHGENQYVSYIKITPPQEGEISDWIEKLKNTIREESIDGIIISKGSIRNPIVYTEISKLYYLGITAVLLNTNIASEVKLFRPISHAEWVRIEEPNIVNSGLATKRVFDLIFAAVSLFILSPLLLLISIAIKATSKGSIFYVDRRIGQNGELFSFPKFRTMYAGADKLRFDVIGEPNEDISNRYRNDPRITPLGRFLRRWSLDELPQFYCVLIGTMSVVGPRPILREELELVKGTNQFRFIAKPGLTGLWQVSGRKEVNWEDRMAMDSSYIQNWTFANDLLLIARTITAILFGRGSY